MTPEELELVPGVTSESVAQLGAAVNSFYGHVAAETAPEAPASEAAGTAVETEEAAGSTQGEGTATPEEASGAPAAESTGEAVEVAAEEPVEASPASTVQESDTIENQGLSLNGSTEN
jgi:hypothetical protein